MCNCAKAKTPNPILEPPSSDDESSHQYHAPYVQLDADINQDVHRDKKYIPENGSYFHIFVITNEVLIQSRRSRIGF